MARRITPEQYARKHLKDTRTQVEIVSGDAGPRYTGESYHYETLGGRRIAHPSAYAKKGWSNMRYVHSTLRIEVGADWLSRELEPSYSRTIREYRRAA